MEIPDCIKVYDIFCRVGKQYDELDLLYGWSKSIGIARSSEYPDIERVTTKKLELMDQYIRDRSISAQTKRLNTQEEKDEVVEPEEEINEIKALPPPEEFHEEPAEEVKEPEPKEEMVQTEGDLLNLGDMGHNQYDGDKLALALFDGAAPTSTTQALPWHAFDNGEDWETTLVQSSSNLSNQKPSLGGGLDTLVLDGLYKHAETNAAMQGLGYGMNGSASSVALGSAGSPAMLALPAPPTVSGSNFVNTDPFAASMAVAPPSYVQMSEIEKRQRLLVQEQAMWQQYAQGGMHGQVAFTTQPNNAYMGGYPQNYGNYH